MKIISVVGKVDTRSIVYPAIRALTLNGLTAVITDDGAYRRLYHGKGDIGNVNGIDVSVTGHVDDNSVHSLDKSGVPYDNLIIVSSDYIHPDATGIIACHGLDRSMMAKVEVEEDDDFIIPGKNEAEKPVEAVKEKKKVGFGKSKQLEKKDTDENESITNDPTEEVVKESIEATEQPEQTIAKPVENPDKIVLPEGIPFVEVQIAYAPPPKTGIIGISLKEGLMNYIYTCEEQKRLSIIGDKNYNATLAKILSPVTGIDQKELAVLLVKEEGIGAPGSGKKKK